MSPFGIICWRRQVSNDSRFKYDIELLTERLAADATTLVYLPETTSTMDIGHEQGLKKAVVVTDHQTQGRGRYARVWQDEPGSSILSTFVRVMPREAMPPIGSLRLAHSCVLAVWQALASDRIGIKWPNDLYLGDRKLGGVLVAEGERDDSRQAVLFGIGLNVLPRSPDTASLSEALPDIDRCSLVLSINRALDTFIGDISRLNQPEVFHYYDDLWQRASILRNRRIRIESESTPPLEGVVVDSPFGGFLQLLISDGTIMEVGEYGSTAHITILSE